MAISQSDILFKLSAPEASAGNANSAGVAGTSLGKYVSTTQLTDNTLNNLFPDITGDQNTNNQVDYQCLFVHNSHASLTYQNAVVWLSSEVAGGSNLAIGLDTTSASAVGSGTAQALTIVNSTTVPTGVTFSSPTTKAAGISLGNIPSGQVRAIWIRRTAANSTPVANDGGTISVSGDSL